MLDFPDMAALRSALHQPLRADLKALLADRLPDSGRSFIERSATQLHVPTRSKLVRAEFVGKKTGRHAPPRPCAPGGLSVLGFRS